MKRSLWSVAAIIAVSVAGIGAAAAPATAASAATPGCKSTVSGTVYGNLSVAAGKTCTLKNARILGTVTLGKGSTLRVTGGSISGNVAATNPSTAVTLTSTTINGTVKLGSSRWLSVNKAKLNGSVSVASASAGVGIASTRVAGSLTLARSTKIAISKTTILGNVKVDRSRKVSLNGNRINGNLGCTANLPAPTGSKNTVLGSRTGQCKSLR